MYVYVYLPNKPVFWACTFLEDPGINGSFEQRVKIASALQKPGRHSPYNLNMLRIPGFAMNRTPMVICFI